MKPADTRFGRRLHQRLISDPAAIQALEEHFGLTLQIASRFRLGLSEPYPKSSRSLRDVIHQNILVAPLLAETGVFYNRYIYANLPSVSVDNRINPPSSWSTGASETYFSRKCKPEDSVIVCDHIRDLWAFTAIIEGSGLDRTHVVIAPTKSGAWPEAWADAAFWKPWKRVNIAISIAASHGPVASDQDQRAHKLARQMNREAHRVPPHDAPDWLTARRNGIRYDELFRLVRGAVALTREDLQCDDATQFVSAASEDLSCSYERGFLFEAVRVIHREDVGNRRLERFETVVVRSDRTLHRIERMPCPTGTPKAEQVFRLMPDGALLRRVPTASTDATWRWQSIAAYINHGAQSPPLGRLLDQTVSHLKASVWLPFQADFLLLACIIAATYCQQVFDAVPLVLVTGPKGSGKTELSIAVSKLCANSPGPVGLISAATLTRLVDASHGFVAIDDLEKIMSKRGGDPQFCDLTQALKLSYKKESAQRMLTDMKQNQLQRLNFFGIKLINNTTGTDEILGSRMLTISTRSMPEGQDLARDGRLDAEHCAQLRDHLHTWAFSHVSEIARTYAEIYPNVSTRDEEIFAPIRVLAQLSGSKSFRFQIEEAIGVGRSSMPTSAIDAMEHALITILVTSIKAGQGLRSVVTVLEAQMRLRIQEGRYFGKSHATEISDIESPEWIGRQFKDVFSPPRAAPIRLEMYGRGTRAYTLSNEFLDKVAGIAAVKREGLHEVADPRFFCTFCANCDYQEVCEMRARKQKAVRSSGQGTMPVHSRAETPSGSGPELH